MKSPTLSAWLSPRYTRYLCFSCFWRESLNQAYDLSVRPPGLSPCPLMGTAFTPCMGKTWKGIKGNHPPMLLLCPQQLPELGRDPDFLMLSAVFSPLCYILHRTWCELAFSLLFTDVNSAIHLVDGTRLLSLCICLFQSFVDMLV